MDPHLGVRIFKWLRICFLISRKRLTVIALVFGREMAATESWGQEKWCWCGKDLQKSKPFCPHGKQTCFDHDDMIFWKRLYHNRFGKDSCKIWEHVESRGCSKMLLQFGSQTRAGLLLKNNGNCSLMEMLWFLLDIQSLCTVCTIFCTLYY